MSSVCVALCKSMKNYKNKVLHTMVHTDIRTFALSTYRNILILSFFGILFVCYTHPVEGFCSDYMLERGGCEEGDESVTENTSSQEISNPSRNASDTAALESFETQSPSSIQTPREDENSTEYYGALEPATPFPGSYEEFGTDQQDTWGNLPEQQQDSSSNIGNYLFNLIVPGALLFNTEIGRGVVEGVTNFFSSVATSVGNFLTGTQDPVEVRDVEPTIVTSDSQEIIGEDGGDYSFSGWLDWIPGMTQDPVSVRDTEPTIVTDTQYENTGENTEGDSSPETETTGLNAFDDTIDSLRDKDRDWWKQIQ